MDKSRNDMNKCKARGELIKVQGSSFKSLGLGLWALGLLDIHPAFCRYALGEAPLNALNLREKWNWSW
jgi:hypothetical protein